MHKKLFNLFFNYTALSWTKERIWEQKVWLFLQNRQTLLCTKLDLRQLLSFRISDFTLKFYVILKTDLTYLMRKFKSRVPHDKLYAAVSMARSHSSSASPNAKSWWERIKRNLHHNNYQISYYVVWEKSTPKTSRALGRRSLKYQFSWMPNRCHIF